MKKKNIKQMIALGSKTARAGFQNEKDVIDRFNNWETDKMAQDWLNAMGYDIPEVEYVKAEKVRGRFKADIQVCVMVVIKLINQEDLQNLQVKLVSNLKNGGNQIDKRWIDQYVELWDIPKDVERILKLFTGEIKPTKKILRDKKKRRMFLDEIDETDRIKLFNFIEKNRILIVSDILKGRGAFSADWTLVIMKSATESKWVLRSINNVMNILGDGEITLSPKKSLYIGKILMQRKGGDGGRKTAQMLQFKINPVHLFGT